MHRLAVHRVFIRVLLLPTLYISYTLVIWLLPTRAPAQLTAETAERRSINNERYRAGRQVWLEHSCQTCHSIYGLGGHVGPDLTNTAEAGMSSRVQVIVREGRGGMPSFRLTLRELNDLVAYLEVIDTSGSYPPNSIHDPVFGVSK